MAVVGAGWAGLAAALALAEAGVPVTLYDAAPAPGGRARSTGLETPLGRFELDNGQHLIVGAYRETLALIEGLGAGHLLHRSRLRLHSPTGFSLHAARLPAPLHLGWGLLRARGLGAADRFALLSLMTRLRLARWRTRPGETVTQLLARLGQPPSLVTRLWAPLCIGALNTLPEAACAQSFAAVLRDTLGAGRSDSDFMTADAPLGALLPEPALARLRDLGAGLRLRTPVRAIRHSPAGWRIESNGNASADTTTPAFPTLLLALPPWSAQKLLEPLGLDLAPLRAFEPEPIATAWAFWPAGAAPALPRWSLLDEDPGRGHFGQWLFDRGVIGNARIAGIVISVASRTDALATEALSDGIVDQLNEAFDGPPPAVLRIVTERRATFRCTPDRPKLAVDHYEREAPGLWLAGDWLWPEYPATIESAVRSGRQAAATIAARLRA